MEVIRKEERIRMPIFIKTLIIRAIEALVIAIFVGALVYNIVKPTQKTTQRADNMENSYHQPKVYPGGCMIYKAYSK